MGRLALLLLLTACAPLAAQPLLPYPGGFAEGGLVKGRFQVVLPGVPLFLDADEKALYAAYPYELLRYEGLALESLPLPGVPTFLRARPGLAVGLGQAVYTERGLLPYPARDAALTEEGLFWVGEKGLHLGSTLLEEGDFRQVVAWAGQVVALGREAYFHPEGRRVPLPAPPEGAEATACGVAFLAGGRLYLLRETGVKPWAEGTRMAALGEKVYLTPGPRVLDCREVVWP